jgi:aldehyde:ferredoxin oxidoreductase
MKGFGGNILRINLTTKETSQSPLPEDLVKDFIGGRGFASKILFSELPVGIDPLGSENKVVIASGPLAGTPTPGAGKVTFAAKSPATGSYGDSNMGGHFAGEMKLAGYDIIILEGQSEEPVYIFIDNDKVELRDASTYWGKGSIKTEALLKLALGESFQIATIGPAGENLVKYACVSHDFGRQAGRTGVGAVLGSKKVKAIAVKGNKSVYLANPKAFAKSVKELMNYCLKHPALKEWQNYGTAGVTVWANEVGAFPTHNFQGGACDDYKKISGEIMRKHIVITDKACFACPMACGKYSHVKTKDNEIWVEGPEYETIALLGGNLGIINIEQIAHLNWVCDELGLDTISAGNVVGFAMECYEKGIIKPKDVDNLELKFGNFQAAVTMFNKIAKREGIGDLLAEGVKTAAEKLGKKSLKFAMQVKGLEWSGYESRYAPAMLLSYLTADIGAHHNRSWAITHDIAEGRDKIEGKAKRVIELQHIRPMFDMLGVCRLQWVELGADLNFYAKLFETATGIPCELEDLLKASERVWNLNRMFLLREKGGPGRMHDEPPARIYEDKVSCGVTKGKLIKKEDIEKLLADYYKLRGWTKEGDPTAKKLKELGLAKIVENIKVKATA